MLSGCWRPPTRVLRRRQLRLGLRKLLLGVDDRLLRRHGRIGARHDILPRLLEVGARIVDVTDGHGGLREHVAVPVQRQDVGLARATELRRLVREVGLGVREVLLGRGHSGLGHLDRGIPVPAAATSGQCGHQTMSRREAPALSQVTLSAPVLLEIPAWTLAGRLTGRHPSG